MLIGVDGGALSITDERLKLGVYWLNVNLLRVLGRLDKKNSYIIYSFLPIDQKLMRSFGPRMKNRVLTPSQGWFSLRLPLELTIHPVDLFLGLSQALPSGTFRSIGIIYDLGFLHHPEAYQNSYSKLKKQTEVLAKKSDKIVTISETVKKDVLEKYKCNTDKVTVAYPGLDEKFEKHGPSFIGRHPYFLFVGALKPGKNVPTLINGFAEFLRQQKKKYDLYLIGGEYWKDEEIDRAILRLDLGQRIQKFGFVTNDKLATYYRGALALVSPSLYEGFGLPPVEAMGCGCPVIGSTSGAMPEVIGDDGILVDPLDVDALAGALEQMTKENVRKSYIRKGIIRAKHYSWDKFAKKVYDCIHELGNKTS